MLNKKPQKITKKKENYTSDVNMNCNKRINNQVIIQKKIIIITIIFVKL